MHSLYVSAYERDEDGGSLPKPVLFSSLLRDE